MSQFNKALYEELKQALERIDRQNAEIERLRARVAELEFGYTMASAGLQSATAFNVEQSRQFEMLRADYEKKLRARHTDVFGYPAPVKIEDDKSFDPN